MTAMSPIFNRVLLLGTFVCFCGAGPDNRIHGGPTHFVNQILNTIRRRSYSDCWIVKEHTHLPGGKPLTGVRTLDGCKAACMDDKACIAFDWDPRDQRGYYCWTHDYYNETLDAETQHAQSTLYGLSRACLDAACYYNSTVTGCLNGGTCVKVPDKTFKCECAPEFSGERCETKTMFYSGCWTVRKQTHIHGGEPVMDVRTLDACQAACIDDRRCVAIDWDPLDEHSYYCWSHGSDDRTHVVEFHVHSTLHELNRTCLDATCYYNSSVTGCLNGGTCEQGVTDRRYRCECPPEFTGEHCEIKRTASRPKMEHDSDDTAEQLHSLNGSLLIIITTLTLCTGLLL